MSHYDSVARRPAPHGSSGRRAIWAWRQGRSASEPARKTRGTTGSGSAGRYGVISVNDTSLTCGQSRALRLEQLIYVGCAAGWLVVPNLDPRSRTWSHVARHSSLPRDRPANPYVTFGVSIQGCLALPRRSTPPLRSGRRGVDPSLARRGWIDIPGFGPVPPASPRGGRDLRPAFAWSRLPTT
jgi:hypothetical protein